MSVVAVFPYAIQNECVWILQISQIMYGGGQFC